MNELVRDELLAGFIAEASARADRGEAVDLLQIVGPNTELLHELTELWNMAKMADCLGDTQGPLRGWSTNPEQKSSRSVRSESAATSKTNVFGDYELLEQIGSGGMGVVYQARHRLLGRIVALKVMRKGTLASTDELARFRQEATALARLDHPQIIPIYDVGEVDGQPFFTMKYIPGATLATRLASGPLSARESAQILQGIARAIAFSHANGVIHRDLKPSNILIDTEGRAHVGDFGLAKRMPLSSERSDPNQNAAFSVNADADRTVTRASIEQMLVLPQRHSSDDHLVTGTGVIIGTPSYMSPEQASGRRRLIGTASDIYSLGAVLYQCLTGRPPFQAASPVDLLLQVIEQDPVPPRLVNPAADVELEMVALKCLQKPPELRYRSATELANDFDAWLANEPVSARKSSIVQLMSRLFRDTHHAVVLEGWGLLWILHSFVLLTLCCVTNWFQFERIETRFPYVTLWTVGIGAWAAVFWTVRRRAGPITFVERQIAHVWGSSMVASSLLFVVELQLELPVLRLSPVLPLIGAMVFAIKAGTLSGEFYLQAAALFATSLVMGMIRYAHLPDWGLTVYGVVSSLCFILPGWKYWRLVRKQKAGRSQ